MVHLQVGPAESDQTAPNIILSNYTEYLSEF